MEEHRRLCIVSSDRIPSRDFIAALRESLHPQDHLEVIMDRRHGGSSVRSGLDDRRRQRLVQRELELNGFAIVPASVDPNEERPRRSPLPLFSEDDAGEERFERITGFRRWRPGPLVPKRLLIPKLLVVLICVTVAAFALSPAWQDLGKSLIGLLPWGSSPLSDSRAAAPPAGQLPSTRTDVASTVANVPAIRETPSAGGPASTQSAPLRDADRMIDTLRETSTLPSGTGTTSRDLGTTTTATSPSPQETGTPPKAVTAQGDRGRPGPGATVRRNPSAPPRPKQIARTPQPEAATSKATRPPVAGSPRVELAREPVSLSWGRSYAVRLLDPAGRPIASADVQLVARRADGTVEKIAMGALPEPGIFRATVPTGQSAPVDLRVRVSNGGEHVEVPVMIE